MKEDEFDFSYEMVEFVQELVDKADVAIAKTDGHSNVDIIINDFSFPVRVDDIKLLYICGRLLPNILNYLVNILPQFIYPYVVSYLQSLSEMREDPVTINEFYNYLKSLDDGNIHKCTETED